MNQNKHEVAGTVRIAQDVLATIASVAALETEGVAGLTGYAGMFAGEPRLRGNPGSRIGNMRSSVVMQDGQDCIINLAITVKAGAALHKVSRAVQDNAATAVSNMTGLNVSAVNINVSALSQNASA